MLTVREVTVRARLRFEQRGYDGLLDHRRGRPSPRAVPVAEVRRIVEANRYGRVLPIAKQRGRRTCAGLRVLIRHYRKCLLWRGDRASARGFAFARMLRLSD